MNRGALILVMVMLATVAGAAIVFGQSRDTAAIFGGISDTQGAAIPGATDLTFVDENGTTIQYSLSGAVINRTSAGAPTSLIGGVITFNMTYFSAFNGATNTGTTTTDNTQVRLVLVQLVTGTEESVASYSAGNQRSTVEMLVRLRNT